MKKSSVSSVYPPKDHPSQTQNEDRREVVFFPAVVLMTDNPYWQILKSSIEKLGVPISSDTPERFSLSWLVCRRKRVCILHFHYFQGFYKSSNGIKKFIKLVMFASNMIAARLLGYRTVLTLHNLEGTYPVQPAWIDYLGHWIAVNFSERVIVHCKAAGDLMAGKYGRRKQVYVVPHPSYIGWYPNQISKNEARSLINLPENTVVFLFFGGIRPKKGIETLIRAFRILPNENYRLLIAGKENPDDHYLQMIQELAQGDNRIAFHTRYIQNNDVQIYLNASDILVLPFTKVLTSGSAILALSFSRPVIVPRMGCMSELVEPGMGWFYKPEDIDSLSQAMECAVNSDFRQAGVNAFNNVNQFTPERFAEQTLRVYCE